MLLQCCSTKVVAATPLSHQQPKTLSLNRKLLDTIVVKDDSSAKITSSGNIKMDGDAAVFLGDGKSSSDVSSKTKLKFDNDGGETLTTVTKGSSTSSEGGTAGTMASAGTRIEGNHVAGGSYGLVLSVAGGSAGIYAAGTAVSSKCQSPRGREGSTRGSVGV